jgi:hypothetical protein
MWTQGWRRGARRTNPYWASSHIKAFFRAVILDLLMVRGVNALLTRSFRTRTDVTVSRLERESGL